MPSSDEEYVQPLSDDEAGAHTVSRKGARKSRDSGGGDDGGGGGAGGFELSRTWENVVEGEDGTIAGAVEGILEGGKRRR